MSSTMLQKILFLLLSVAVSSQSSDDYYGQLVGTFSYPVDGDVFIADEKHIQIVDLKYADGIVLAPSPFIFASDQSEHPALTVYNYQKDNVMDWLQLAQNVKSFGSRILIVAPGGVSKWRQLKVVGENQQVLTVIELDKHVPRPHCCFETKPNIGLKGEYGIISKPIEVLDSRTIRIKDFSYKASETPDGYFFAGTGDVVDQTTGKKAQIVGRDTPNNICAMLADISHQELIVRLSNNQSIYNIEWLSVFCYQYNHDFGHMQIGLIEDEDLVPAYIPEVFESKPVLPAAKKC